MAKRKNLEIGTRVQVKESYKLISANTSSKGKYGTVESIEPKWYDGRLVVLVKFDDGDYDWMHNKDVRLVK